jgi:hypothetical protein
MLEAQEKVVESEEIQQSSTEIEQKLPVILGDMKAVLEKNGITGLKVVEFKLVKDEDIQAQLSSNPNRVCCKRVGFTVVCGSC